MSSTSSSNSNVPEPEFLTRFQTAKILGRDVATVARMEEREGLLPVRISGHVLYPSEAVAAVVARWKAEAAWAAQRQSIAAQNRQVVVPAGWQLLIVNAHGPFIGEYVPEAPALAKLIGRAPELQQFSAIARTRRCIVSYDLVTVAFQVAEAEGLNVITNGRGIVAVKKNAQQF